MIQENGMQPRVNRPICVEEDDRISLEKSAYMENVDLQDVKDT